MLARLQASTMLVGSSATSTCGLQDEDARQQHALHLAARQLERVLAVDFARLDVHVQERLVDALFHLFVARLLLEQVERSS